MRDMAKTAKKAGAVKTGKGKAKKEEGMTVVTETLRYVTPPEVDGVPLYKVVTDLLEIPDATMLDELCEYVSCEKEMDDDKIATVSEVLHFFLEPAVEAIREEFVMAGWTDAHIRMTLLDIVHKYVMQSWESEVSSHIDIIADHD